MQPYQIEEFKSSLPYQGWIPCFDKVNLPSIEAMVRRKVQADMINKKSEREYETHYIRNFNYLYKKKFTEFVTWIFKLEKFIANGYTITPKDHSELQKYKAADFPFWYPTTYSNSTTPVKKRIKRMTDKIGQDKLRKKRIESLNKLIEATLDPKLWSDQKYQELKVDLCKTFTEHNFWGPYLNELIKLGTVPKEAFELLVNYSPEGKSDRFDRIYAWALQIAYPKVHPEILKALVGIEGFARNPEDRFWKVIFDKSFGLNHMIIRAHDFTEAYGKAADLYMRLCLANKGVLPDDMTIRVQHLDEKEVLKIIEIYRKKSELKDDAKWERVRSNFEKRNNDPNRYIFNYSIPRLRFLYSRYFNKDEGRELDRNGIFTITSLIDFERPTRFEMAYDMGLDFRKSDEYRDYRPDLANMDELIAGFRSYEENSGHVEMEKARIAHDSRKHKIDINGLKIDLGIVDSDDRPDRKPYISETKIDDSRFEIKPVVSQKVANSDVRAYKLKKQIEKARESAKKTFSVTDDASTASVKPKGRKTQRKAKETD